MFECEACPVAASLESLEPTNRAAWDLFQRLESRFLFDTMSVGPVLLRLVSDLDDDSFVDMITRLGILYDRLHPPQTPKARGTKAGGHGFGA